jgi:ABC-type multidrug transport system fused ATPase/permease subunit
MRLLSPIQNLMGLYAGVLTGSASLARAFEVSTTEVEIRGAASPIRRGAVEGAIEFEGVSFGYDAVTVLDNVSFRVEPGVLCAILGRSGAGTSTIGDLLVRFQDPDRGVVRLDGADLRDLRLSDVRPGGGQPEASEQEIVAAARAVAIHERIEAMPQGYDTLLGERGMTLSAGERHRSTLARALLRNPPCWCSTNRQRHSTPIRSAKSRGLSAPACPGAPRS